MAHPHGRAGMQAACSGYPRVSLAFAGCERLKADPAVTLFVASSDKRIRTVCSDCAPATLILDSGGFMRYAIALVCGATVVSGTSMTGNWEQVWTTNIGVGVANTAHGIRLLTKTG